MSRFSAPSNSLRPAARFSSQGAALTALAAAAMPFLALSPAHAEMMPDDGGRDTIIVTGKRFPNANPNADPQAPYKVDRSADGKFTEPLRDTPKTITAIPKEVIEDMGATSFREVVRSTPGVTLGTGEGGNAFGDRIFIRGFEARNDVYIDGMRDPGVTSREIFAVEQIEVVKGPSGSFGGRGTTGGLVSLQSKKPSFANNFLVAAGGVGTENYWRGTIDANYRLSDKVALRINGLYHNADTPGRDYVNTERYGATAALTAHLTDALSVGADYYYFRLDGIPDYGHPFDVTTGEPYKVDRDNFYGVIGRDFIRNGADVATLRIEFEPIPALSFRSNTRYGKTYNHYVVAAPGAVCRTGRTLSSPTTGTCNASGASVPEDQYTVSVGAQNRWADNEYWANITDVTAKFDTGGIGHTVVFGGEFARETVKAYTLNFPASVEDASGNLVSTSGLFRNLLNPDPVLGFDIPVTVNTAIAPRRTRVQSLSAYAIDTIKFTPQLSATLGARYDSYDLAYANPSSTIATERFLTNTVDFWNWQASLLYKPVEPLSLYVSFATSSNPSGEQLDGNGTAYNAIASQTATLEPERNKSWEAGAKYEVFNGELLLTAAAFQITKDNARENIGNNVYQLVGKLRSRGLEFGATGNLGPRIQIFAGYTLTDAKITQSFNPANVGRRFANIPKHSGSVLANYLLAKGLEIGGQVYAQSRIYGEATTVRTSIPGYVRLDAMARYRPSDEIELRLNVLNLTDKRYYDAIYRSNAPFSYVAPGRSVTLTGTISF